MERFSQFTSNTFSRNRDHCVLLVALFTLFIIMHNNISHESLDCDSRNFRTYISYWNMYVIGE